jgi:hypothetical protein
VGGAINGHRDGVGGAMAKDDKTNIPLAIRRGYGRKLARLAGIEQPFTDEEIEKKAWAILNILDGDEAERRAILLRVGELDKILDDMVSPRMAAAKWVDFARHTDSLIKTFDIKGESRDEVLRTAFKIMRKISPDLAKYKLATLKSRYHDGERDWAKKLNKNNKVQK